MPARINIDTRDLLRAQKALRTLGQPQLRTTTGKAITLVAKSVVVPEMQHQVSSAAKGRSPVRPVGMGPPKRGTKGPLAKSVRSKQLKKNKKYQNEMIAIGVAPRAWYRQWFINGTKPHSLDGGANLKKGIGQNRGHRHPGSAGHDIVTATGRAVGARVATSIGAAVLSVFAKQMGRKP